MVDTSGEADIRGLFIQKLATGFAEEDIIFKRFIRNSTTSAREIRWYQKTSGFLDSTDTTGITASQIRHVPQLALPDVIEQSITRNSSTVEKFMAESPWISFEDIKDNDPNILSINVRDITRAVAKQVDAAIWDVMTESRVSLGQSINEVTASGAWSGSFATANPVKDLNSAEKLIRQSAYATSNLTLFINAASHASLKDWLITKAGSSIPAFSSQAVQSGVVMTLLGHSVVVSENVTSGYGVLADGKEAVNYMQFMALKAQQKEEPLIGLKIRVAEEGVALLENPKAVTLLSGIGT